MLPEIGQTIELIQMDHDPLPIQPGTRGVVTKVTNLFDGYQISVNWNKFKIIGI